MPEQMLVICGFALEASDTLGALEFARLVPVPLLREVEIVLVPQDVRGPPVSISLFDGLECLPTTIQHTPEAEHTTMVSVHVFLVVEPAVKDDLRAARTVVDMIFAHSHSVIVPSKLVSVFPVHPTANAGTNFQRHFSTPS